MKILIVIPTYNEIENIGRLIDEIFSLQDKFDILVVDDNSPDGTGALVEDMARTDKRLHIIHRKGKLGLGSAYIEGFKFSISNGYDYVFTMDADFSHGPEYIPHLFDRIRDADVTIGSRYVKDGSIHGWPLWRRILSISSNSIAKIILGLSIKDCTSGFRCYGNRVLSDIGLGTIRSNGYSFLIEILYRCLTKGYVVVEVPIRFIDRKHGASKISKIEIWKAVETLIRLKFGPS